MRGKSKAILFAAAAFALTALLYLPTAKYSFCPIDDYEYVIHNPHVHKGLTLESAKWAFTAVKYDGSCEWHPLAWLSEMFDISVSGATKLSDAEWEDLNNPASTAMHMHNFLLHAANASLLFLLLLMLSRHPLVRRSEASFVDPLWLLLLTLFWSLHPLRSEVVCWAAERKELTCTFFMLLTLMAYFSNRRFWAFIFCCLAMMGKPMAVTLPVVLLAWDWIFGGKIRFLRILPFFALSAATSILTVCSQQESLASGRTMLAGQRLTTIFGGPVEYLAQTFWPVNLSISYRMGPNIDWALFAPGVILAAAIFAGGIWWLVRRLRDNEWRNSPADVFVFAVAWCYVCLTPMMFFGVEMHSDRYTYWSGIGLVASVTMLLASCGHRWRKASVDWAEKVDQKPVDWTTYRRYILLAVGALVVILTIGASRRISVWRNPKTLMLDVAQKSCAVKLVNVYVGWLLRDNPPNLDEAERWLRECADQVPGVESNLNLARFLFKVRGISAQKTFSGEECSSEPELILKQILLVDPQNSEAKSLLDELCNCKLKAGDKK